MMMEVTDEVKYLRSTIKVLITQFEQHCNYLNEQDRANNYSIWAELPPPPRVPSPWYHPTIHWLANETSKQEYVKFQLPHDIKQFESVDA